MNYEQIRYSVAENIATLTLSRPERLNAYTAQMRDEIVDAFDQADADDSVRAIVVTGDGRRAFCVGADLAAGGSTFDRKADNVSTGPVRSDGSIDWSHPAIRDGGGKITLRIFRCLKPVIAAINGDAVGIGVTMQLPMDIRLCSDSARFGFVFNRRGIIPEAASSWFLPRVVGISRALEWTYRGVLISSSEALESGLVRSVHAPDDLLPAAYALARDIADNAAPVSIALTRQMMWRGLGLDDPMEAHKIDSRGMFARGRSADVREGVGAFIEKRQAIFPEKVSTDMPDYFPWWNERLYE